MRFYIILALTFFVLLTTRWMGWNEGIKVLGIPDVTSYQTIAESSPSLPNAIIPYHHAQRLFGPFTVGLLSRVTGIDEKICFYIVSYLCIVLTIWAIHKYLVFSKLSLSSYSLCMSILLLNPFLFRLYLIMPGMLPDIIFALGLALILYGMGSKRVAIVLTGTLVSALGRQTALLLIPGLLFWLYYGNIWKDLPFKIRTFYASATIVSAAAIYFMTGWIVSGFTGRSVNVEHMIDLFRFFNNPGVTTVGVLGYISYLVLPIFIPVAAIAGITIASYTRRNQSDFEKPAGFWGSLLMAAGIILQPALAGPLSSISQGARLSAFAVIPLTVCVAHLIKEEHKYSLLTAVVLMSSSLHYKYTAFGPDNIAKFGFLQVLAAISICALIARPWEIREKRMSGDKL